MALKDFSTPLMIAQTGYLLDPSPQGGWNLWKDEPLLAGYVSLLRDAVKPLDHMEAKLGKLSAEIAALTRAQQDDDMLGDSLLAGVDELLLGGARVCEAYRQRLEAARAAVLGAEGRIRLIRAPYAALAGEAAQMRARLTEDDWDTLAKVQVFDVSAADALRLWLKLADAITQREAARAALRVQADDSTISRADVVRARHYWVRTVKAFLSAVEVSGLSDTARAALLAPLQEADRKAVAARDAKTARAVKADVAKAADAPAAVPAAAPDAPAGS